ncbi:MAG: arginine--tRNA ligase [Candidatus Binatia bacterium]|nr:arginine--tRNA ligase [Candidatus Binatia bacterium]
MKDRIEEVLERSLAAARDAGVLSSDSAAAGTLEVPKDRSHGDLATNVALTMAKAERKAPRAIAEALIAHLDDPDGLVESTEIAGPGFLNFRLSPRFWQSELAGLAEKADLGVATFGAGKRVQVEFVSANPTGPLTVGHGRNAVLGDTVARLLSGTGHDVEREYYFNNAGRQMKVLGTSVEARYLEEIGRPAEFPDDGYQGDYIREIAHGLVEEQGEGLADHEGTAFRDAAEQAIFKEIRRTQDRLGVVFDNYFNEDTLYSSKSIEKVLEALEAKGLVDRREGAVWLRGEKVGLEKDRVLVKSSGEPAYRLPDIAYHQNKLERGFDQVVVVLGADHIEESREVTSALAALGYDAARVRPVIYQFVTLTRDGEQVKMSTRRAEFVTLDDLLDEVGIDAVRFFFLSRKSDSHLEFDLELAQKRSTDNPVYYVQYAHARVANLFAKAKEEGVDAPSGTPATGDLAALTDPDDFELIGQAAAYAEVVGQAARELEPHRVVFYLQDLAATLHRYYNRHRILGDEAPDRVRARLALLGVVQKVLAAGLSLLGVSAPERM